LFARFSESSTVNPSTCLLARAYQPYLALLYLRSLYDNSLTLTMRYFLLVPDQLRLSALVTFVVCIPSLLLLTKDVTRLLRVFLREGSECETSGNSYSLSQPPVQVARALVQSWKYHIMFIDSYGYKINYSKNLYTLRLKPKNFQTDLKN